MGQRIMDRVMGRKSDRHATTLVIQRASPSLNDDARASFEPEPPARDLSSLFPSGGTTRERRASSAARASAAVRGTPPKGTSVSTVAPPLARLAADARNPKGRNPPGSGNCDESGPSAPRREELGVASGPSPESARPSRTPPSTHRTGTPRSSRACTTGAELRRLGGGADGFGGRRRDSGSGATRGAPLANCPASGASTSARGSVTSATLSPGFAVTPASTRSSDEASTSGGAGRTSSGDAASVAMASSKCVRPLAASQL